MRWVPVMYTKKVPFFTFKCVGFPWYTQRRCLSLPLSAFKPKICFCISSRTLSGKFRVNDMQPPPLLSSPWAIFVHQGFLCVFSSEFSLNYENNIFACFFFNILTKWIFFSMYICILSKWKIYVFFFTTFFLRIIWKI